MDQLLDDAGMAERILDHIDHQTTDLGEMSWREPVANYLDPARLEAEIAQIFRRTPTPFCPSAALAKPGAYIAREAAGVPLLAVRGADGAVRVFRNACRHRGAQLACGAGREKAFVCPYHGWTYALDGALRAVPHDYGFPGLDKAGHGLVPVHAEERGGLVFVTQDPGSPHLAAPDLPADLLPPELELVATDQNDSAANWKISAEGFLEGYHIYATHRETFFPVQFDNLNVIEHFGRNSRIAFPYRNVQKLREVEPARRRVAGAVTYVYHLFPNVMVATFPQRTVLIVLEPLNIGLTRTFTYTLAKAATKSAKGRTARDDADFVSLGAREDVAVVQSIQRGLASGANEVFEFGRFEAAIVHFHQGLYNLLGEGA